MYCVSFGSHSWNPLALRDEYAIEEQEDELLEASNYKEPLYSTSWSIQRVFVFHKLLEYLIPMLLDFMLIVSSELTINQT